MVAAAWIARRTVSLEAVDTSTLFTRSRTSFILVKQERVSSMRAKTRVNWDDMFTVHVHSHSHTALSNYIKFHITITTSAVMIQQLSAQPGCYELGRVDGTID